MAFERIASTLLLTAALSGSVLLAPSPAVAATDTADTAIAEYLDRSSGNAVATAVLDDGAVMFAAEGQSAGRSVDERTPFRIASMSKSFTAALVMILVERGDLTLDAPVIDVLPGFEMADERFTQITVRMLLAHTSGLGGGSTVDLGLPENVDAARLLDDLRDETLGSDPGDGHVYFNVNYALAALIVERIVGEPFAAALERELLGPLGMADTVAVADCATPVSGVDTGHTAVFGIVLPLPEPHDTCLGSGGVVSTAADMAQWLRFQAGDGSAADGTPVLSAEGLAELHRPQPGTETTGGYGLGWSFTASDDLDFIGHGGALTTWTSHMVLVRDAAGRPSADAAVVLTDTAGAPGILAHRLAAEAAGIDGAFPPAPVISPALVFGAATVAVLALGVIGVVRAGSFPSRRRRTWMRAAGVVWPAVIAVGGIGVPPLLAVLVSGSALPVGTAWHMAAGVLPEAVVFALALVATGLGVSAVRGLSLRTSR